MAKLAESVYAQALFRLAEETGRIGLLYEEAEYLAAVWKRYPDFARLIGHPQISAEDKNNMMNNVFEGRLSGDMMGFISVIIRKERYQEIMMILRSFIEKVKAYRKAGTAYVSSAAPLTAEQREKIEKRLMDVTGFKSLQMYYSVDLSLIGGLVIRVDNRVVDSSLRTQLERMAGWLSET